MLSISGAHLKDVASDVGILEEVGLAPKSYFHCVGFFKDIKNPWRILQAYRKYVKTSTSDECKQLVLVGRAQGKKGMSILEEARSIPNVVVAGRVDDQQLAAIYQGSAGLIFPSLYEGFGIPILEAQSFGCPVITSNVSSMPEVAGDGAVLVDPHSMEAIYRAMRDINNGVPADLVKQGKMNLSRFSWETSSHETLDLILKVASERDIS